MKGFFRVTNKVGHEVDTPVILDDQLSFLVDELSVEGKSIDEGPDKQKDLTLELSKLRGILGNKGPGCAVWC